MKKTIILIVYLSLTAVFLSSALAASPAVRVKDIAHVLQARDNQLIGFGLVVGLKNTGDTIQTGFTRQALTNLLSRMGIPPQDKDFKSRNVAAVMVTAKLPPFVNSGQKIDVTVSSLGDATSLQGGTLLMTPLQGPDDNVYAVAQGQLSLGVMGDTMQILDKRPINVGRIPGGGIVEKGVPVSIDENFVTIVIDQPDYTTASRIVSAMKELSIEARARDAATIIATKTASAEMVGFISEVENVSVVPDSSAKITISETTGVVVMGENVRIAPVVVSFGGTSVTVSGTSDQPGVVMAGGGASVSDLVAALNAIGVRPKDLIAILQAIRSAGALSADIEVI